MPNTASQIVGAIGRSENNVSEEFEKHINDKAPAFRCYACGDQLERLTFTQRFRMT